MPNDHTIHVGDHVTDRDSDSGNVGLVTKRPGTSTAEHTINPADGTTVDDVNDEQYHGDTVIIVEYPAATAGDLGGQPYAYPAGRLKTVACVHDDAEVRDE